jgi:hypothetical protein
VCVCVCKKKKTKIHDSWGKCLRSGFLTPVGGKRGRWGGPGLGPVDGPSGEGVGTNPSLFPHNGKRDRDVCS